MKHRIEVWTSTQNREEIHYFEDDMETYFFGYNPEIIPEELIKPLIEYINGA